MADINDAETGERNQNTAVDADKTQTHAIEKMPTILNIATLASIART